MKKTLLVSLILVLFCSIIAQDASAQDYRLKRHSRHLGHQRSAGSSSSGSGGGNGGPQNVIKIKPAALVGLAIPNAPLLWIIGQYEIALTGNITGAMDLSYLSESVTIPDASTTAGDISSSSGNGNGTNGASSLTNAKIAITGFGISPEIRYYFAGAAPKGIYVAGFGEYYSLTISASGTNISTNKAVTATASGANAIGGGILFGYHWIIGNVFSIDSNLGVRFISLSSPSNLEYKDENGNVTNTTAFTSLSVSGVLPAGNLAFGFAF